jgi:cell division protein FtsB
MAYSKRRISHKKELYYIICIIILLAVLLFSFFGPGGYRDLRKSRIELQQQRTRVEKLKRSNYEHMKSIKELQTDKKALEKYAREKGYGKQGEIIQQLPDDTEQEQK